jgi:hypothetical protein
VSKDYSEFSGPKHKSVLAAQKVFWQNTFESVLDFQNTFEIYLLGQFIRSGEKLFQRYIRKRLKSVIALDEEEKIKIIILTNDTPFGRVASLSIFPCLESLGCWIPHHQSDSCHPHGVCLIVGDEGDVTVSGFVLRPLGGPGSPYFQSSSPCLNVGAVS